MLKSALAVADDSGHGEDGAMRVMTLVVLVACGKSDKPATPPASGSSVGDRTAGDVASSDAARAAVAPCLPSRGLAAAFLDGQQARYCRKEDAPSNVRHCIAIAPDGTVTTPPPDEWPEVEKAGLAVLAPAGWTAKASAAQVEVCKPDGMCTKIALAAGPEALEHMQTIAVVKDHLWVDRGAFSDGPSRVEVYMLSSGRRVREVAIPTQKCTDIAGVVGELVLVQGNTDCKLDHTGKRALATADGEVRHTSTTEVGITAPFRPLDAARWAISADGVEIWDVTTVKRIAHDPMISTWFAIADGKVLVTLDNDGTIARYDAELKPLGTSKIARCGS
jgi:hypothetical protein